MLDCKMRLTSIFLLTAFASLPVVVVVVADSCDSGPVFWCQNPDNAEVCDAVDYCREFVWETASVETNKWNDIGDAKRCGDCKTLVIALIRLLGDESTTLIQDVILDKVCPRSGKFRIQCEAFVGNFLKPVAKVLLSATIDPGRTCKAMKACSRNILDAQEDENFGGQDLQSIDFENLMSVFDRQETSNRTACTTCQEVFKYVRGIFQNPTTVTAVKMALQKFVCSLLGPAKYPCKAILKIVIPRLFKALAQLLKNPAKICRFFRICMTLEEAALADGPIVAFDSTEDELKEEIENVNGNAESDECLVCKRIALNFENFLKLDDISKRDQLNSLCQEFSEQEKSFCVSLMEFGPTLANRLSAVISPELFCEKVSICPTEEEFGKSYPGFS